MNALSKSTLPLKLKPISIGKLSILNNLEHPAYGLSDGRFVEYLSASEYITKEFIRKFALEVSSEILIHESDYESINDHIRNELNKVTRSLSIGDPLKNATRQVHFLSLQMSTLYDNPFNDEVLSHQFQSSKNLSTLLIGDKTLSRPLFHNIKKQGHHYIIGQPLLSSIILLNFFQTIGLFSEKEIQNLFLTSYFKDLGMSFIPKVKFESETLNDFDMRAFSEHAQNSIKLLSGRVPLGHRQLEIIKNHHFLNNKIQDLVQQRKNEKNRENEETLIYGMESVFINAMDILVAMTSTRPYREAHDLFKALELLKKVISDEYPHEFKNLVNFVRQFFLK